MKIEFISTGKSTYYGSYDAIIDELGVILKDINNKQAKCLKSAENTEYLVSLIETIRNNPEFDLETFAEEMKLEDIVSDTPSKILVSAQSSKYSYITEDDKKEFRTYSHILTREQYDILKQCIAKNKDYNFWGATEYNHGFDIETFGIEFISNLNDGLDEYTYDTITQNKELLEKIKTNPEISKYMANVVNEYRKIQYDIESAPKDNFWYYDDYEYDPKLSMQENEQRRKELSKKNQRFNEYNVYKDDIADLKSLFQERLEQLNNYPQIGEFEETKYRYESYDYNHERTPVDIETLREENAIEYLKHSGREKIEVVDTDKAFVKKALKVTNDLIKEKDEQGQDITYLQSMLQQRIEGKQSDGSYYENVTERQLLENLLGADWEEISYPDVMEGCRVFKCNLLGVESVLDLDKLDENAELYAMDPNKTGNIEIGVGNAEKKATQETYLITGKETIDGVEKDIVITFHPGEPAKPSQVKSEKISDGSKLTVKKAKKLGIDKARYLSEDMLQMYRQKYEKEKPFFKKFLDKIKGIFNRNKKLAPISNGDSTSASTPTSTSTQNHNPKNYINEIRVEESELQKNNGNMQPENHKQTEIEQR